MLLPRDACGLRNYRQSDGYPNLSVFPAPFSEERQPLLMPVLFGDSRDHFTLQIVQRSKQGQSAVANIIVRRGLDMSDVQRQSRLGTLQRLTL